MEIYIVGLIISGILFTGFIILSIMKKNKPALGCLSFSLFILFYCLSNLYEDNYSIESLITTLGLSRGDILTYEFNIKQGLKHCKIKGNYTNNQLELEELKSPKNEKHDLCPDIKKYTELKFIGQDWPKSNPLVKKDIDLNIYN
mgnify:FL=1|tara:strand:+ start:196 stop:627 length:432 start_codon:yes stop_codon:yes gene_type:complete